ncbi:MAG TPA: type I polyketide synthase, partial [Pseudonocardiaceae bacterium]|nr:type I polyketide synthase [Pseudonocardiaceae bacterium]
LEQAGIDPGSLAGPPTGVFAGAYQSGYTDLVSRGTDQLRGHLVTGGASSAISGRVSYSLGLEGPAVSVDTACSSSLVAMHLAAQALRAGECNLALAGGVTVMATPDAIVGLTAQGPLAGDGRCKSFADSADGAGWSEGIGVVVLERLSDAERHGHQVLAVLRSSAVNQDGASNGLTAPNGPSQQRVIRQALAAGGLSAADIDAVEAHGTGTRLGDPIEAQALLATYGQDRPADQPLWLGSLKSNIGHTQAAAGVGGVIKMVLAMRNGVLPKTLHVDQPSSQVDWTQGDVQLLTEAIAWPETDHPRRAGVSSFGISGTNAHVILEAPAEIPAETSSDPGGVVPWVLSGKTEDAVRGQAARLLEYVESDQSLRPADIGWSLVGSRAAFDHRVVVVGENREDLLAGLRAAAAGEPAAGVSQGSVRAGDQVVFVFPGQGGQWVGMAQDLLDSSPVFAESMRACEAALAPFVDFSVADVLGDEAALARVDVVQPALWAVMVSLTALWRSFGVEPTAVVGASQGEIAAACAAGELSLEDGARIVGLRSRLLAQRLVGRGVLASVVLPVDRVRELLPEGLSIAGVNGPTTVTVAGPVDAVEEFAARLTEDGVRARVVASSVPTHCAVVDELADEMGELLRDVRARTGSVPFYSTVIPGRREPGTLDADYWFANMREPVSFQPAIEGLLNAGLRTFIEVSPHSVLIPAIQDIVDQRAETAVAVGTLRRGEGTLLRAMSALAQAYAQGVPVDWAAVFPGHGTPVPLPTYAFQHQRFWPETATGPADVSAAGLTSAEHPLLGAMLSLPETDGVVFTSRLSLRTHPWLADHAVRDTVIFPGTGYVELAIRAGDSMGCDQLDELVLEAPLVLPAQGGAQLQVVVGDADAGRRSVSVYARADGQENWTRHATGVLSAASFDTADHELFDAVRHAWPLAGATTLDIEQFYQELGDGGFAYGPMFQGLTKAWRSGDLILAEVELPESGRGLAASFGIHPALLDAALHAAAFVGLDSAESGGLPFSFSDVMLCASGASRLRVALSRTGSDEVTIAVADSTGSPVLSIGSLAVRPLGTESLTTATGDGSLLQVEWIDIPVAIAGPVEDWIVVDADLDEVGAEQVVVLSVSGDTDNVVESTHELTSRVLGQLQHWLSDERFVTTPLVVRTRGAVPAQAGESVSDLAAAAVWGLVRSAQSENPGRIILLDTDAELDAAMLGHALAADEPQLALREGRFHAARLVRVRPTDSPQPVLDTSGTVVITGAGGLGGVVARHLVNAHGVRHLLLLSRRGMDAPGAAELVAELDAEVTVASCDVTDGQALAEALASVSVTGVVHTAGVLDDGVIGSLSEEQLDRVLAPKVDAAWHLHELTQGLDLSMFVVFSSLAGILGGAGQGNYAAGNAFLDALIQQRRDKGLPGLSMAWGAWTTEVGLVGSLSENDLRRIARSAIPPLSVEQGMILFDRALCADQPVLALTRLNVPALRAQHDVPAVWRSLAGSVLRRTADNTRGGRAGLAQQLAGLSSAEREQLLVEPIRESAAAVLGHASSTQISGEQPFKELGFDSLTAVELRNLLQAKTGLRLASSVVFDYPTITRLARHLAAELGDTKPAASTVVPALVSTADDPIVVVGMACRFPGGVSGPNDLWRLVTDEADAVAPFPADRGWDLAKLMGTAARSGTSATGEGGFIDGVGEFDAAFFRISPREALATDPQQRLLLEVSWEALERAGITPTSLTGSATGVFVGAYQTGYTELVAHSGEQLDQLQGHLITGGAGSVISGRVAYALGLEGP